MGVEIAGSCCILHSSHPSLQRSSSSSAIPSSISSRRSTQIFRRYQIGARRHPCYNIACSVCTSPPSSLLHQSFRRTIPGGGRGALRRAISAGSVADFAAADDDDDDEYLKLIQKAVPQLQQTEIVTTFSGSASAASPLISSSFHEEINPLWPAGEPMKTPSADSIVEMKANSVHLPVSLRMIKRRKRMERKDIIQVEAGGGLGCCSVTKAFSSMVFIVREVQSFTLQSLREAVGLQGIVARVQTDMNASFVWLFQRIFSCTPVLMVSVMLLLANFTVHSVGAHDVAAVSRSLPIAAVETRTEDTSLVDAPSVSFSSSDVGRTASVGSDGGGGGKVKPVAGANDDGGQPADDEVLNALRGLQVSPVSAEMEPEHLDVYWPREFAYHRLLSQVPDNAMVLSNFAQFLFLIFRDHDRAEHYFKQALAEEPEDADVLCRYALFLWLARKDLEAAEDMFVRAVAAAAGSAHVTGKYACFLWNTGGKDTCYPLDGGAAR